MSALYDEDFYAWTREQARILREAAAQRVNVPVDWEHLAEEVDDLGNQIKDAIRSHLSTVIEHLLKLEYSPDANPRRKWRGSVIKARRHLLRKLEDHPSLRSWPQQAFTDAWHDGYVDAIQDDSVYTQPVPEETCPYTLDQIVDENWWPANRHGLEG